MPLTVTYTIVPFVRGAGDKLHPAVPRHLTKRDAAITAADHLAPFYAGVIVLKQRSDATSGTFLEPLLVCVIGDVPDNCYGSWQPKKDLRSARRRRGRYDARRDFPAGPARS